MRRTKYHKEQWEEIQVAFDRRNGLYVAYSTETGIVGSGVCVPSAVEQYKSNYYERQEILREEEIREEKYNDMRISDIMSNEPFGGSLS